MALAPYFASYLIVCEFITYAWNLESVDRGYILTFGFCALGGVVASMLLNGAAFTLSHFAAYRILYNLRLALSRHLALLPLGFFTSTSKGEIRKTLQENVELIENFIAHKIPEFIQAGVVIITQDPQDIVFDLTLLCVIIFSIALIVPLLKISNLSRSLMQINEGVERIDKIFSTAFSAK